MDDILLLLWATVGLAGTALIYALGYPYLSSYKPKAKVPYLRWRPLLKDDRFGIAEIDSVTLTNDPNKVIIGLDNGLTVPYTRQHLHLRGDITALRARGREFWEYSPDNIQPGRNIEGRLEPYHSKPGEDDSYKSRYYKLSADLEGERRRLLDDVGKLTEKNRPSTRLERVPRSIEGPQ